MLLRALMVLVVVAVLAPLRPAYAQAASPSGLQPTAEQLTALAQLQPAVAAESEQPSPATMVASEGGDRHTGVVLMIVGIAGVLTGLIVDESTITVIGAVVGGVGLFMYLK